MTYQQIFLQKLAEKWFENRDKGLHPDYSICKDAANEAYEEFKKQEAAVRSCGHQQPCRFCAYLTLSSDAPNGKQPEEKKERCVDVRPGKMICMGCDAVGGHSKECFDRIENVRKEFAGEETTESKALEKLEAVRAILKS